MFPWGWIKHLSIPHVAVQLFDEELNQWSSLLPSDSTTEPVHHWSHGSSSPREACHHRKGEREPKDEIHQFKYNERRLLTGLHWCPQLSVKPSYQREDVMTSYIYKQHLLDSDLKSWPDPENKIINRDAFSIELILASERRSHSREDQRERQENNLMAGVTY